MIRLLAVLWLAQDPEPSERLQRVLDAARSRALAKVAVEKWEANRYSVVLVDLKDPDRPTLADYRGEVSYYPASVVKLCYMAAVYEWARGRKLVVDDALLRDLRAMIGPSDNKATQRIVDRLCGTSDGPALSGKDYEEFASKRNSVNRWLQSIGLKSINACQKTYDGGDISPRDEQFLRGGKNSGPYTNRNLMTPRDAARLLARIATGRVADAASCAKMLELMKRDLKRYPDDKTMTLGGVPPGSKVWAKIGWVRNECHEAALVELPSGRRFVLVVFTTGRTYEGPLIAELARAVSSEIEK